MRNRKLVTSAVGFIVAIGGYGCAENKPSPMQTTQLSDGYRALQSGNADAAIDRANEYLRKEPHGVGSAEALYLKGRGYEMKTSTNSADSKRNLVEAKTAYGDALNENPSKQLEGNIRASLSNVAFFMEDFSTASAEASRAYQLTASAETQSVLLYRMGVSQQRMGRYTEADTTFKAVESRYPGSEMANRAGTHEGVRNFYLQLATYNTPAGADRAIEGMKSSGLSLTKRAGTAGQTVVNAGPFQSYDAAKEVRARMAGQYPDAIIVP